MKNHLLIISLFCCSLCFGQLPSSGKYCIDVVKSDNGKYNDSMRKESARTTAEVSEAVSKYIEDGNEKHIDVVWVDYVTFEGSDEDRTTYYFEVH